VALLVAIGQLHPSLRERECLLRPFAEHLHEAIEDGQLESPRLLPLRHAPRLILGGIRDVEALERFTSERGRGLFERSPVNAACGARDDATHAEQVHVDVASVEYDGVAGGEEPVAAPLR
jgi:hypothetical protein